MKTELTTLPVNNKDGHVIRQEFGKEFGVSKIDTIEIVERYDHKRIGYKDKDFTRLLIGGSLASKWWMNIEINEIKEYDRKGKSNLRMQKLSITVDKPHLEKLISNLQKVVDQMENHKDREVK